MEHVNSITRLFTLSETVQTVINTLNARAMRALMKKKDFMRKKHIRHSFTLVTLNCFESRERKI